MFSFLFSFCSSNFCFFRWRNNREQNFDFLLLDTVDQENWKILKSLLSLFGKRQPWKIAWFSFSLFFLILFSNNNKRQVPIFFNHHFFFFSINHFFLKKNFFSFSFSKKKDAPFVKSIEDVNLYFYWMNEKRLALDAIMPGARFHEGDHIIWISFDRAEHFIGSYGDLLELLSESHMFVGDACRIILKKELKEHKKSR